MKFLTELIKNKFFGFVVNILITATVSVLVVQSRISMWKEGTFSCDRLNCKTLNVEYISVHEQDRCGEQPMITIQAREDFAGIQMSDFKNMAYIWINPRGKQISLEE